jgi:hypothetical protein
VVRSSTIGAGHRSDELPLEVFPLSGDDYPRDSSRAEVAARAVLAGGALVAALPRLTASAPSRGSR